MFKNYCKVALRNLRRHQLYTFINVLGLALGIACCILIMLLVRHEWSYDSFHKNADALFRVLTKTATPDGALDFDTSQPMPLAPALHAEFPEIKGAARFRTAAMIITYGDKSFSENVTFTDRDIFSMFEIEFVNGNPASALQNPTDIVLTQAIAKKYFGEENPFGKLLSIQTKVGVEAFAIAGIIKPMPSNSSVQFELLANISQNSEYGQKFETKWASIVEYSSLFAVTLTCLGLFGLVTLTVINRTKEIGLRKVLGASVSGILGLLSKDFLPLVVAANVVAWPIAYIVMNRWLQNFAYRIDIGWEQFALAGGSALLIASLTISAQAIKAALANPVEALRYE